MRTTLLAAVAAVMAGSLFSAGAAEIVLSWNNRTSPEDPVVQRKVVEIFRKQDILASWRAPGLGSGLPTQVSVWVVDSTCEEFTNKTLALPGLCNGGAKTAVAAVLRNKGITLGLKNRVYVFLPQVRLALLCKEQCNAEKMAIATSLAIAHEVTHLVLGTDRPHDKKGLFAAHVEFSNESLQFAQKTVVELRSATAAPGMVAASSAPPPPRPVPPPMPEPRPAGYLSRKGESATTVVALANEE